MAGPKLSRRSLLSMLPLGLLGLAGCSSYTSKLETDAEFLEIVLRAMPDFRLTSAIIGKPVVLSPGYALRAYDNRAFWLEGRGGPQAVFSKFISQFDDSGLPAVNLYINGRSNILYYNTHSWRLRFPGCSANECIDLKNSLHFDKISQDEHDRYSSIRLGKIGRSNHQISEATLSGVAYRAKVNVFYDYQGRVIRYVVRINREGINDAEFKWGERNGRIQIQFCEDRPNEPCHFVAVYRYVNNLVLGVDEFSDSGGSARIRKNSESYSKGL